MSTSYSYTAIGHLYTKKPLMISIVITTTTFSDFNSVAIIMYEIRTYNTLLYGIICGDCSYICMHMYVHMFLLCFRCHYQFVAEGLDFV